MFTESVCTKLDGKKFLRSTVDSAVTSHSSPTWIWIQYLNATLILQTDVFFMRGFVYASVLVEHNGKKHRKKCKRLSWCIFVLEPQHVWRSLQTFWDPLMGIVSKFLSDFESCWIPWCFCTPSRVRLPFYHI